MKKTTLHLIPFIAALAGCASSNPDQIKKDKLSTLKVYDDNSVALAVKDSSGRTIYAMNEDSDRVIAVEADGKLYNLKDIAFLRNDNPRGGPMVDVGMVDGSKQKWSTDYYGKNPSGPKLNFCNRQKECSHWPNPSANVPLITIYSDKLFSRTIGKNLSDHSNDFYKTFSQNILLPQSSSATSIQIVRDAELQKLKADFAARRQFNEQSVAQLRKEFDIENKASEQQVAGQVQQLKKAAKGTEEFCRAIFFGNVEKNRFECPNYGTHNYSTILEQGWIISNRLPRPVNNMVQQGVMYDVVFKKMR